MKLAKSTFSILTLLVVLPMMSTSVIYAQTQIICDYQGGSEAPKLLATGYNPPSINGNVNIAVIYACENSSSISSLPSWYQSVNRMQDYLIDASHGNHSVDLDILTDGNNPFRSSEDLSSGSTVYDMISEQFVRSVLNKADAQYDFTQFDNDGSDGVPDSGDDDGYVDFIILHIVGSNVGNRGGIGLSGASFTWSSNDIGTTGDPIEVTSANSAAIQQTVLWGSISYSLPIHEYGHSVFDLPDIDHVYTTYYDHYGLGSFDVMSHIHGFNGVPSIYNPKFRDEDLGWLSPDVVSSDKNNSTFGVGRKELQVNAVLA